MKVFISHSSEDKPQVELLAHALRECGFEPWLDKWEIGPGDDIVASINAGLDAANAGIIVFSSHTGSSRWVDAEVNTLTYMRIMDGKLLIPVVVGDAAWVPPLLRPLARRGIDEIDAIIDALRYRQALPSPIRNPEQGRIEPVSISLRETLGEDG
ncbi:MAG: toll/interleukin-1 receptor domain-containing protein, partial [Chlorobiaceae bacterium]|nr:toll/interleukin-1 receptor domain-containing protein [Chlorobiaceae bacterium]